MRNHVIASVSVQCLYIPERLANIVHRHRTGTKTFLVGAAWCVSGRLMCDISQLSFAYVGLSAPCCGGLHGQVSHYPRRTHPRQAKFGHRRMRPPVKTPKFGHPWHQTFLGFGGRNSGNGAERWPFSEAKFGHSGIGPLEALGGVLMSTDELFIRDLWSPSLYIPL